MEQTKIKFLQDERIYLRPVEQDDLTYSIPAQCGIVKPEKSTCTQVVFSR